MGKLKKCKACGTDIAKTAKTCPNCGKRNGLPGWAKALIIVLIIMVCLVSCVNSCSNAVNEGINETEKSYKDINGKTSFKINESFQNAYEKITLTEVNTNFTDYSKYLNPANGNKYIMVKFEFENVSKDNDELYVSDYGFNAYADNVAVDHAYIGNDNYNDLSATIGIGKKTVGYIFYEVPKNAKEITIEYNANFWVDGNTIEFVISE